MNLCVVTNVHGEVRFKEDLHHARSHGIGLDVIEQLLGQARALAFGGRHVAWFGLDHQDLLFMANLANPDQGRAEHQGTGIEDVLYGYW